MRKIALRISFLVTVSLLALALASCGGDDEPLTPGAKIVTEQQLKAEVAKLGYPVYWLGPKQNTVLEYTKRDDGRVYIRYLKPGTTAGSYDRFLTAGTYPMPDAYDVVKQIGQLPDATKVKVKGGIGVQSAKKPESVYVAFRGKDLQLEVYSPDAGAAVTEVTDGNLVPFPTD
jgi:hypothetical protein